MTRSRWRKIRRAIGADIDWLDTTSIYVFGHPPKRVRVALAAMSADERPLCVHEMRIVLGSGRPYGTGSSAMSA